MDGCHKNKIVKKKAKEIFRLMAQFADYGFNRSHSVAYAHVAYQTAYLKAQYPEHFYAAVMTYTADDATKIFKYGSELRSQGIKLLPPDVNESGSGFTPVEGAIRFGLAAIKGLGQSAVSPMLQARGEAGRFSSIYDFAERVGDKGAGKRVLESLVCAGAFDSFKPEPEDLCQWRANLHATVDRAMERGGRKRREQSHGQGDMFGAAFGFAEDAAASRVQLQSATCWSHKELLANEKAAIGFYVSGHPLEDFLEKIEQLKCCTVADLLATAGPDARCRLAGVVSDFTVRNTKKGDKYAYFRLEDLSGGTVKCVLWPETFKTKGKDAANDALLLVTGKLDGNENSSTVVCDEIYLLEKARIPAHNPWLNNRPTMRGANDVIRSLVIELPAAGDGMREKYEAVSEALLASPGDCEVFLELHFREEGFRVRAQPARFIRVCQDARLEEALTAAGVTASWVEMNAAN